MTRVTVEALTTTLVFISRRLTDARMIDRRCCAARLIRGLM